MTERQHGDTESRLMGFEARLQDGFAWANDHGREIVIGIAAFLLVGGVLAALFEWRSSRVAAAAAELAGIEARYTQAMGSTSGEAFVPEPANADQARKAREAALAELDAFVAAHGSSDGARIAGVRAAELEVDLGRLPEADQRLAALDPQFAADDPRRAVALRLRGYVLDQRGEALAAAEVYESAARIESYPPRVLAWIEAGDAFARAAQPARAVAAYRQALASSPEVAEQQGVLIRIGVEQAKLDAMPAGAASPAAAATPPVPATSSDK
jgi:predicted negative regulator of RcsB-dependent stress response